MMKYYLVIIFCFLFNNISLLSQIDKQVIVPQPREYYIRNQISAVFYLSSNTGIILESSSKLDKFAYQLNNDLRLLSIDTLKIYYDTIPNNITRPIYLGIQSTKLNILNNLKESFVMDVTANYPGAEGYALDIMPSNCTINASDSAGLYFGIKSFIQLVKSSKSNSIFACRIVDAPEFPIRWVYYPMNFLVDANVTKLKTMWQQFSDLKLNGSLTGDVKYDFITEMPKKYRDSLASAKKFAESRFFNFVPAVFSFGYSNSLMFFNPNYASGLPVRSQKFYIESDTGRLVPSIDVSMSNGGFENHTGNNFPGFLYIDQPGVLSFADTDIKHSGNVSVRFEGFDKLGTKPNARVVFRTKVSPFKQYKVSFWVKTENLIPNSEAHLTVLNTKGKQHNYANLKLPSTTNGWKKIDIAINSLESDTLAFYWGVWGAQTGKIWWDDLSVEECAFTNLLRREGTPINVDNPLLDLIIREGIDFDTLRDSKLGKVNSYYGDFDTYHQGPTFKVKKNSIKNGDIILISYYHAILVYDDQVMVTMSDENLYNQIENQFKILDSIVKPKYYFMSHDEIRTMNWDDGDLQRQLTPGQLLAENTNRCFNLIKKYNPNANVWDWSDMYDEYHNAVKKDYYLVNGDLTGSADLLDKNIGFTNWNSGQKNVHNSLNFFAEKGFKQISAPFYDTDENSIRIWKNNSKNTPNFQGMVYTTWQNKYNYVQHFAEYSWNHAPYITHQPISYFTNYGNLVFQTTVTGDKYFKNWQLDNIALYYKTKKADDFIKMNPNSINGLDFEFKLNLTEKPDYFCYYIEAVDKDGWKTKVPYGSNQYYEYFLKPNDVLENDHNTNIVTISSDNDIIIFNNSDISSDIKIYDLNGKLYYSAILYSRSQMNIQNSIFEDKVYFIEIVNNIKSFKKFIKVGNKIILDKVSYEH